MTIACIIVLFKKKAAESETIQSLLNLEKSNRDLLKVILWDNSPSPLNAIEIELLKIRFPLFEYRNTPENISLAKIYNNVIFENPKDDFLLLFDQDSYVTDGYFKEFLIADKNNPNINLFVPLIHVGTSIVSPGDFFFFKGKYWKKERIGVVKSRHRLAITSGMAIRMDFLLSKSFTGFDERLSLYGIDTQFMIHYQKNNEFFFVLAYDLNHKLSQYEDEDVEIKVKRYINHKYSLRIIMKSKTFFQRFILEFVFFIKSFYLAIKNRNMNFFKQNEKPVD